MKPYNVNTSSLQLVRVIGGKKKKSASHSDISGTDFIKWVTNQGNIIPIRRLDDQHLVNIINLVSGNSSRGTKLTDPYAGRSLYEWYTILCDEYKRRWGHYPDIAFRKQPKVIIPKGDTSSKDSTKYYHDGKF